MLTALHIENIAIIDRLDLEFDKGLTVFTGETGAGKSIIIDSIMLLLGNKASKDLIRSGENDAAVSACFCALSSEALALLDENGLQPDEEGNVAIYRKIGRDGKNNSRINGVSVTVSLLKELGQHLINIHGQHDGVLLLDSKRHLSYLDEFSCLDEEREKYASLYQTVREKRDRLAQLKLQEQEKETRRAYLTECIAKLNACDLKIGEHEQLLNKRKNLIQNEEIIEGFNVASVAVYDGEMNAAQLVRTALDAMLPLENCLADGKELAARLAHLANELDDLGAELGKRFNEYLSDRMDPEEIEKRLDEIEAIKKEFGPTDQDVINHLERYIGELDALDRSGERLEQAEQEFTAAKEKLEKSAESLSLKRIAGAKKLEKRLAEELCYLDMPGVRFSIPVVTRLNERGGVRYRADGKDDVAFYLSSNAGEELKPLSKVASGGELSRIMLSLKAVLNKGIDTVIYDEIDTGVSGATADKIGKKLSAGAKERQVFCVTHLAQIASRGDHHMKVMKKEEKGRVCSTVHLLSDSERAEEIARIMGGEELSETLLRSAKEILENNRNND
ncbi:MAG: DNA repair protein RecN [Clostridia bacterium]|nr:DNA repair protein RecN [Clostridia bacterium]